ncbi:MAG: shikimate dehydrogenase [Armatimonadota bacterium]|nr:shikimate dehydrogenase [Armatimonadota bacterium]MDW8155672.1 shikimate dehydrogenase [Armatimonadota bacterium]
MEIPPDTRLVALVGDPVAHSLSPRMQAAAFQARGLRWAYLALRVRSQDLREAVAGLRALGFAGANVTIPHKVAVCELVDELDPSARRCGAANTLVFDRGRRVVAFNTDVAGFARALAEHGVAAGGVNAVVLGAGGAARAACAALGQLGSRRVTVMARRPQAAEALCAQMRGEFPGTAFQALPFDPGALEAALRQAELVVNATPVGMHPHEQESPVPDAAWLRAGQVVFDMVYNPPRTRLVRMAEQAGARVVGGLSMLVHQGAAAFELWTGVEAPVEAMKQAVGLLPAEV